MPIIADHIARTTGCNLLDGSSVENARALNKAAQTTDCRLQKHLYEGVVGFDANRPLGSQLTIANLRTLSAIATRSLQLFRDSPRTSSVVAEFGYMCDKYAELLECSRRDPRNGFEALNKQTTNAEYPNAVPRHTLWQHGPDTYELLTWMSDEEIERVQNRFARYDGIRGLTTEKTRLRRLHGELRQESKVTLGKGAFGTVALARHVQSDTYLALKKAHPIILADGEVIHPKPLSILPRVNDGTRSGIATVFLSEPGFSTSVSRALTHGLREQSVYTMLELGVCDLQKLFDWLSYLRYLTHPDNVGAPDWQANLEHIFGINPNGAGNSQVRRSATALADAATQRMEAVVRLSGSSFADPEKVRRFMNRLAFQMLESVNQMHQAGFAHNDIKPNNFVVATGPNGYLRVKLVDFDMSANIGNTIGVPREIYAKLYAAPQVQSTESNNNPRLNDAYSVGCSIKALEGATTMELIERRAMATGRRDEFGESIASRLVKSATGAPLVFSANRNKPVMHRREIEALHRHLPEFADLHTISDLLCHPNSGKRYRIDEAMNAPPFNQPEAMLDEREFSDMLGQAIRHTRLIEQLHTSNQPTATNVLEAALLDANSAIEALSISSTNTLNATRHLESRARSRQSTQELIARRQIMERDVQDGNTEANIRRIGRALNPVNLLKSKDRKEAEYSYKSRRS